MKSTRFLGLVCLSFAVSALPAAAQTPDGVTPSRDSMCDVLDNATPGLKGLCVAMCEAQDCGGILDPGTGDVTFDESCNKSSYSLLANYRKKAGDPYAAPPCIRVPCSCWTESEIDNIGGGEFFGFGDSCTISESAGTATLFGWSDGGVPELAYALENGRGLECIYQEETTPDRNEFIGTDPFATCRDSVLAEIESRGLTDKCMRIP